MNINMASWTIFMLFSVLVWGISNASNYDNFLRNIEMQNEELHSQFRKRVPNGDDVLTDYYGKLEAFDPENYPGSFIEQRSESETDDGGDSEDNDAYWAELLKHYDKYFNIKYSNKNEEELQQNNLWGEHKVSGGAGKSQGSKHEQIKSDKLPAYCNPPNPCPVGMDPEKAPSPCQEQIPDTKEFNRQWIWDKMDSGECTCDVEHMRNCKSLHHKSRDDDRDDDDEKLSQKDRDYIKNVYLSGNKHQKLVAKKAPKMLDDHASKRFHPNPYLQGEVLDSVKKKAGSNF